MSWSGFGGESDEESRNGEQKAKLSFESYISYRVVEEENSLPCWLKKIGPFITDSCSFSLRKVAYIRVHFDHIVLSTSDSPSSWFVLFSWDLVQDHSITTPLHKLVEPC